MQASKREWEEFLRSNVWADFRRELLMKRSIIRDELEEGSNPTFSDEFKRGEAKQLREIAELPDVIVQNYDTFKREDEDDLEKQK